MPLSALAASLSQSKQVISLSFGQSNEKKRKNVNCHSPARSAEELFSQKFTSDGPEGLMSTDASFKKVFFLLRANFADLALVEVVDDSVIERLFELPLGL